MYQSFIEEVVGNWFYMVESMSPQKQRSLRQAIYRKLQKKLMYPVQNAYEQVKAALYNETLSSPCLYEKVNDAIYSAYQV